ncbi:MAG: aminoacyl-tRNA hydrolase [Desulfobulbaceae bacterium]|nr:aminoacyl-tRNA hydrolase [Desulfobulbaceae bacterium]
MLLLVGLGNPGGKYENTRHNVGFMFLDFLAEKAGVAFKASRWEAAVAKTTLQSGPLLLVKPTTFMNLSGQAVARLASFYQIEPSRIVVVHDDLDLDPGRIKLVFNRGAGGHNGIKSIIDHLGTCQFARLRVGIGRPAEFMAPAAFVLSRFTATECEQLVGGFAEMAEAVSMIDRQGVALAMNFYNRRG